MRRDLKPGNLLMGAIQTPHGPQLVVKVADFGLARVQVHQACAHECMRMQTRISIGRWCREFWRFLLWTPLEMHIFGN